MNIMYSSSLWLFSCLSLIGLCHSDFLTFVNYRALVGRVIDISGDKYSVINQNFPCTNNIPRNYSLSFVSDPDERCSCFGNCTIPVDCYIITRRKYGNSELIVGTSLQTVKNVTYYFREPEKLFFFEPDLDFKYNKNLKVYCFQDREYGAVIHNNVFKILGYQQKFSYSYFRDRVVVNFVARNYLFSTIRDQFYPDVELSFNEDFVYSCFNNTKKFNSYPNYDCSETFPFYSGKFRCKNFYGVNLCPDTYTLHAGIDVISSIVLPYVSYDGESVTPDYLSNKFIPNYMHGLKGIFPDVLGWFSGEMNKLIRVLGNILLDSVGYIINRVIQQIIAILPLVEEFVTLVIKTASFLFRALVKVIVVVEKQIFFSEYFVLYLVAAYYMNLEIAPVVLVVICVLIFGLTRWFPSLLLLLLNGEFKTEVVEV